MFRADRSNYDEHDPDDWERSQFDSETLALVLKVMTAKATQRLLLQLQVGRGCRWLPGWARVRGGTTARACSLVGPPPLCPDLPSSTFSSFLLLSTFPAGAGPVQGAVADELLQREPALWQQQGAPGAGSGLGRQSCVQPRRRLALPTALHLPQHLDLTCHTPRTHPCTVPGGPVQAAQHGGARRLDRHRPHHRPRQPGAPHHTNPGDMASSLTKFPK